MKKYFLPFLVLIMMVTGSAFVMQNQNEAPVSKTLVQEWFIFTGSPGEENDPSKYELVTMEPDCPEGSKRCAVYATRQTGSNPVVPNLSQPYDIFTKP